MADAVDHGLISEPRHRFRFSLRDLMALVFGLAVGLAAARQSWVEWHEGVLVAAVCWIMLGLGSQILDLGAALRRTAGLSAELRWGGRFAIAWRAAAIAILGGYCAIEALIRQGLLVLHRHETSVFDSSDALRKVLFYFAIVVALASVPRLAQRRPAKTNLYRVLQTVAWVAAISLCLLVWLDCWTGVVYLVHLAISGIEATFPLRFADPNVDLDLVARTKRFVVHTSLATALVPLNLWLTSRLARAWSLGTRRRWGYAVCLLSSLGATIGYLVWFRMVGLPRFSPCFAENPSTAPLHFWLTAGLALILASGAASYRLACSALEPAQALGLPWRREPRRYYHERRLTMLALSVALGGSIAATLYAGLGSDWGAGWGVAWAAGWANALNLLFTWPENYIILAAFWLALRGLFGGWRNASESIEGGQIAISPRRLGAVWLAMFVTLASSIPLIAWFCFSLWLLLGYRFDWP